MATTAGLGALRGRRVVLGVSGGIAAYKAVERRLARADAEEQLAEERFDAVIVNDDLGRAADELAAIVEARRAGA